MHRCHEQGLLVIKAGLYDNVIRVLAPLVITEPQLDEALGILERVVAEVDGERGRVEDATPPGEGA